MLNSVYTTKYLLTKDIIKSCSEVTKNYSILKLSNNLTYIAVKISKLIKKNCIQLSSTSTKKKDTFQAFSKFTLSHNDVQVSSATLKFKNHRLEPSVTMW